MADITATVIRDNSTTATVKVGASMLQKLSDVDASVLSDGSMIIYDEPNKKFKTTTSIETDTGTIVFNGGVF
jgi:hypothetical protein